MRLNGDDVIVGVHKADTNPFHPGHVEGPIPDAEIRICRTLPVDVGEMVKAIDQDAEDLATCLMGCLPTATMNRLLANLLEMKAGDLRWPMKRKGGEDGGKAETGPAKDAG